MSRKSNSIGKKIQALVFIVIFISTLITPGSSQIAKAAVTPPVPIAPADGTVATVENYPPLAIPEFKWSSILEAVSYRLQISGDIGFSTTALEITTPHTTYTPVNLSSTLFADGDWYWRVRVESPGPPSEYSNPVMFTKNWASTETMPQLYEPTDNVSIDFYEHPVFSWSRVSGAARYRFQIAVTTDSFNQPVYTKDTLAVTHQPTTKPANGLYYWRVVPLDPANHEGTSSEIRSFTISYGSTIFNQVPIQISPENNSFPTFTPTFSWTAIKGASIYRMEYTSDPGCSFQTNTTAVLTRNTSYTPTSTFPNDINYCWRVRVESGKSIGEWSSIWIFQKRWYLKSVLLAPTNNYKYGLNPLYQWTPVPGASYYRIFSDQFGSATTTNTFYSGPSCGSPEPNYWYVQPFDGSGNEGKSSDVDSFTPYCTSTAPVQIYPFYYYLPNDPSQYGEFDLNPVRDLTAPMPLFIWNRTTNPPPIGGTYADAYRLEVSTTPYFGLDLVWDFDTENTSAVPTLSDNFTPIVGQDYYWRVCPLDQIGGECLKNFANDDIWWSQIWKTRIDTFLMLPPTDGAEPQLIRPVHADEIVEATPLLEWWPYQDADYYQVQISRDPNFSIAEDEIEVTDVTYSAYSPQFSIAQRSLGRLDYGTFYWRVRASVGGSWSNWSDAWRFQIASQSEWLPDRSMGYIYNRIQIGDDPDDVVDDNYELTNLNVVQSGDDWWFGFNAITSTIDMSYVLYLDLDHVDGSGATFPPSVDRPYDVSTIPAHQPEFAIFVDQEDEQFSANNTYVYTWEGTDWSYYKRLSEISDGDIQFVDGYLELKIPDTAINMASEDSSGIALMVFSVDTTTGKPIDSVPPDPNVPGSGLLSRFTSVSEDMNLIFSPDHSAGDPRTYSMMMPFFWDHPTGSDPEGDPPATAPWKGAFLEIHLDPGYTNQVGSIGSSGVLYLSPVSGTFLNDVQGDNTYYWRARTNYSVGVGSWNEGGSFEIVEFIPQNLQTSVTFATPTFTWDMVEGAATYDLQVATDPSFGSGVVININTALTSYIPTTTLANDDYFWRVRIRRYGGSAIKTDWSDLQSFTLSLPKPSNLIPNNEILNYAPTFCWDAVLENDPATGYPVLAAWKYRLQVSKDPTFSTIYEQIDTEQVCYTPAKGYDDGAYYWRVAMIDGNGRLGDYSSAVQFTKQYPITTLVSPVDEHVASTPTFMWTPVDGAARYRLEISQYSTFSPLYDSTTTVNTQYTPLKLYEMDRPYYWRVGIIDADGRYGPFNDATIVIGTFSPGIYLPLVAKSP